jgi:uncharacterized protein YabE (DUF348 family)
MRVRPTRVRRLRIRRAIGNGVLAAVTLAVGIGYLALQKDVTLVVDGRPHPVRTMSADVGGLLSSEGIVLEPTDVVVPAAPTPLRDGMTVVVDRRVFDGSAAARAAAPDVGVWVMEGGGSPVTKLVSDGSPESVLSAGGTRGSSRTVNASVVVMGKDNDVLTNAGTVRELLSAMGVDPSGPDRVLPSPSTPLHTGIRVRYQDVRIRTASVRVPIPYAVMTTYTNHLEPGHVRTIRGGEDGVMVETFRVKVVDGEVASRRLISRHVVRPAVPERRLVGHRNAITGSQVGEASWYYAPGTGLTAAHPWLPFGTVVTVTNVWTGKQVRVVIDDRGPFGGRIIDLSPEAFARIAPLGQGVCRVRLTW